MDSHIRVQSFCYVLPVFAEWGIPPLDKTNLQRILPSMAFLCLTKLHLLEMCSLSVYQRKEANNQLIDRLMFSTLLLFELLLLLLRIVGYCHYHHSYCLLLLYRHMQALRFFCASSPFVLLLLYISTYIHIYIYIYIYTSLSLSIYIYIYIYIYICGTLHIDLSTCIV